MCVNIAVLIIINCLPKLLISTNHETVADCRLLPRDCHRIGQVSNLDSGRYAQEEGHVKGAPQYFRWMNQPCRELLVLKSLLTPKLKKQRGVNAI